MNDKFISIEDFVSDVLTGIVKGAVKSNEEIAGLGGRINPRVYNKSSDTVGAERGDLVCRAEFDIALSVSGKKGGNVKVGVFGGLLGGGGGAEAENRTSAVSRVKFAVPYTLPQTVETKSGGYQAVPLNRGNRDFSGC